MLLKLSLGVESDEGQNCHFGQPLIISCVNWELFLICSNVIFSRQDFL